jgi:hypothetical protein
MTRLLEIRDLGVRVEEILNFCKAPDYGLYIA